VSTLQHLLHSAPQKAEVVVLESNAYTSTGILWTIARASLPNPPVLPPAFTALTLSHMVFFGHSIYSTNGEGEQVAA
jgi:hypothetical protein